MSALILSVAYLIWRERSLFIALRLSRRRHSEATKAQAGAIAESETRLKTIVEGSIQGILIHKDSKPLFVNKAYATIHGYADPNEILELPSMLVLVAPEEHENLNAYAAARIRGDDAPTRYEYKGVRKDGAEIWLENIAIPTQWEGQNAIQATVIDVTEQVELREKVHKTEALLHDALNTLPSGLVLFDSDDKLALVNEAYRQTFPEMAHLLVQGAKFEDLVRESAERGLIQNAIGREDEFVRERLAQHHNPKGPVEFLLTQGK
ncbi:MAG: PAS domain S-box protein [Rhodospirillaceae bacterium]|nr:PAS domain S-box protein [Rhodospirillaceae bacterium]MBT5664169.1 PAS domain S-box protein [Rhodospirillaceae bacterium]